MAKTGISFDRYDSLGISQDKKEISIASQNPFFKTNPLKVLLSTDSGSLAAYNKKHAELIKEINQATDQNIKELLKQLLNQQVTITQIGPLLFPNVQSQQDFDIETRALYETAFRAALLARKDGEARAWLTTIGEYAQSKIIELPWHIPVQKEFYFLTLLTISPDNFLNVVRDKKLVTHFSQYIYELNAARQSFPLQLNIASDKGISYKLNQHMKQIAAIHKKYSHEALSQEIKNIEEARKAYYKKYWGLGRLFYNFTHLKDISRRNELIKLRNSGSLRSLLEQVSCGTEEYRSKCEGNFLLIEAKRFFSLRKDDFLTHPERLTICEAESLRSAVGGLLANRNEKREAKNFLNLVGKTWSQEIKNVTNSSPENLAQVFIFFSKSHEVAEFSEAKNAIAQAIMKRVNGFTSAQYAMNYLNKLALANPQYLHDEALNNFIAERYKQYQAWIEIESLRDKIRDNMLSEQDVETFYNHAILLGDNDTTAVMKNVAKRIAEAMEDKILKFFDKKTPSLAEQDTVKLCLKLFQTEKLAIPHAGMVDALKKMRHTMSDLFIEKINNCSSSGELKQTLTNLQSIWPDPLKAEYIEFENQSEQAIFLPENQHLSLVPKDIAIKTDKKNYLVQLGGVTLQPKEKRVMHCLPIINDDDIANAIQKKQEQLGDKLRATQTVIDKFKNRLDFLKEADKGLAYATWKSLVGNKCTELTEENQNFYVTQLINDYVAALTMLHEKGTEDEKEWLAERIISDVEAVSQAMNVSLNQLLNKEERSRFAGIFKQKIDATDMGRLLLQWQFINEFRRRFSAPKLKNLYKHAGTGIIYKMDEIAKDNPKFVHEFLGGMTFKQLQALNETFVDVSVHDLSAADSYDTVFSLDLIGDKPIEGSEGQTILRKSMLLSAVSELVKQELLKFLNGDDINVDMFDEHVNFVCSHLPNLRYQASVFNRSRVAEQLKQDLHLALTDLLIVNDEPTRQEVMNVIDVINEFRGFICSSAALKNFCKNHNFNYDNILLRQNSLRVIAEQLFLIASGKSSLSYKEIFIDKMDIELINILDTFVCNEYKKLTTKPSNLYNHFSNLQTQLNKLEDTPLHLVNYIQQLPIQITDKLPNKLSDIISHVQYAFADRFSQGLAQLLSGANLKTTEDVEEKLLRLRSSAFNRLAEQVITNSHELDNLFRINKTTAPLATAKISQGKKTPSHAHLFGTGYQAASPLQNIGLFKQEKTHTEGRTTLTCRTKKVSLFSEGPKEDIRDNIFIMDA